MAVNGGNGQSATVGTAVAVDPSVPVRDVSGNPVSGVAVTFAVAGRGGTVVPVTVVTTNASGIATTTSWTLGTTAGANTLTADAAPAGITGDPVTFTATGVPGAATQLIIQTQPSAAAQSGVASAVQPAVRLGDAFGNLVATSGTVVTAALASGTGTLGGTLTATTSIPSQAMNFPGTHARLFNTREQITS